MNSGSCVKKPLNNLQVQKDELTPLPLYNSKFKDVDSALRYFKTLDPEKKAHVVCDIDSDREKDEKDQICEKDEKDHEEFSNKTTILLGETKITTVFEMPSMTELRDSEEGKLLMEDIEKYHHLTTGKGKNRKVQSAETQTTEVILITKHNLSPQIKTVNSSAFVSAWDMYDSYAQNENKASGKEEEAYKFYDFMIIMERVLVNNVYRKEQECFKNIGNLKPLGVEDNFSIRRLWKFDCEKTRNIPVVSLSINSVNTDILAVGYGKHNYSDENAGIVCIWSIKNPKQPERCYEFEISVTSIAFSSHHPNLLAVGFYNGDVIILDIISKDKSIRDKSDRESSPCYEPIWYIGWENIGETKEEKIISFCQDGRVNCFEKLKNEEFVCSTIMRITKVGKNTDKHLLMNRNLPCITYCRHPEQRDIYYIGTGYGNVYKCTFADANQYISFFKAHNGPVYKIEFSKFCTKIFLTCGADWSVKIWIEGVSSPLIVLSTSLTPIMAATFCPTISTIIAAISGTEIFIWDLNRKNDFLVDKFSLSKSTLTKLVFTQDGRNIFVSDTFGVVYVYNLRNLPSPNEDQEEALIWGIKNSLLIKPNLLKKCSRLF